MGKLHELLAAESELASIAQVEIKLVKSLFGAPDKFIGRERVYRPLVDGGLSLPEENTEVATTVADELSRLFTSLGRWLDASVQKETTNQATNADVFIDGRVLLNDLPAPALLNLESKLAMLKSILSAIPVNDMTERWSWDEEQELWVSDPRVTYRTEKTVEAVVGYEATPEHPAQVQYVNVDNRVGEWVTRITSGQYRPSEKRELLDRVGTLIRAVKQARQRANNVDVADIQISETIFDYLNNG